MALLVEPRERIDTSSGPRVAVEGREDGAESGCATCADDLISFACSEHSRMGQLRERAPITSICLSSAPWSQYWRI